MDPPWWAMWDSRSRGMVTGVSLENCENVGSSDQPGQACDLVIYLAQITDPNLGKAPLSRKDQQRFDKARQKALIGLANPDCQKFLTGQGIDPSWVTDAIHTQIPYEASKSTITLLDAGVYPPYSTPPAFYSSMSVSRYFSVNQNTMGMAQALGTDAYYRPGGIFGGGEINSGNIFHESLHNALGLSDPDLAEKLGKPGVQVQI